MKLSTLNPLNLIKNPNSKITPIQEAINNHDASFFGFTEDDRACYDGTSYGLIDMSKIKTLEDYEQAEVIWLGNICCASTSNAGDVDGIVSGIFDYFKNDSDKEPLFVASYKGLKPIPLAMTLWDGDSIYG